jgi:hypothetical protein
MERAVRSTVRPSLAGLHTGASTEPVTYGSQRPTFKVLLGRSLI